MKRLLSILFIFILGIVLVACNRNDDTQQDTITIRFGGSTSVEKAIQSVADAFKAEVPRFNYEMVQTGSSDGYKRTLGSEKDNNPAEIGFASRSFKDSEDVTNAYFSGTFALDAIAVVVHKDLNIDNLTQEQIKQIFTGVVTDWSEINSNLSGTINIYTRDEASGTREAFQDLIGFTHEELTTDAIGTSGNGDMATKVGKDDRGIGYVSLATDFEGNGIKPVQYNGVKATVENTNNESYTLARPFNFTTRSEDDFASVEVKQMVAAFIAYLGTKDAMAIMAEHGVVVNDNNAPIWENIRSNHPIVDRQ